MRLLPIPDGSVVTWGNPTNGGDSSGVQGQLVKVQQVAATRIRSHRCRWFSSVVLWDDPEYGGDCSAVQIQLQKSPESPAGSGQTVPLPPSLQMIPLLLGVIQHGVVTTLQSNISSRGSNRFRAPGSPWLPFCRMGRLLAGVPKVGTVLQSNISSSRYRSFMPLNGRLNLRLAWLIDLW